MLTPDQMSAGMGAAFDQMEATIRDHERAAHGGGPCAGTRYHTVAWIAHRLGLRLNDPAILCSNDTLTRVAVAMAEIEADCPHCKKEAGQ